MSGRPVDCRYDCSGVKGAKVEYGTSDGVYQVPQPIANEEEGEDDEHDSHVICLVWVECHVQVHLAKPPPVGVKQ